MVDPIRYIRKLTVFLVISGTLNIILMGLVFYWTISERPPTPYFELKPANKHEQQTPLAIDHSDGEVIRYFRRMPLQWLISRLNNTQLVENGYTQRDLALASLVAFHYFDLERAFSGLSKPEQRRLIVYGKFRDGRSAELVVYPGLSDKHFEAIRVFATTERWPLTTRGLFLALQKEEKEEYDPYLLDAFFMSSEFSTVEMLFSRNDSPVSKEELLKVLLEGNWTQLSDFVEQQKVSQDLSQARRQNFLLEYARNQSKAATQLLLKIDTAFAVPKIKATTPVEKPSIIKKPSTIMTSPPPLVPKPISHQSLPPKPLSSKVQTPPITAMRKLPLTTQHKDFYYVVQEGDSLWKIGRRFSVEIEVLRAFNQLDTDALYPGKTLRIPAAPN